MRFMIGIGFAGMVGLAALLAPAIAHMGATGVVKERMELMLDLGKTAKALNAMARGKVAYDGPAVMRAAKLIEGHSAKMPTMFPEGSMKPPSEARPEISTNMKEFRGLATALKAEAVALAEVGRNGDRAALAKQFRRIGKACSACHKTFRSKKRRK